MKVLFIVGNGFDLDHNVKTDLDNFREFLKFTYGCDNKLGLNISTGIGKDGEVVIDPGAAGSFLITSLSNAGIASDWSDFENTLGKINSDEVFPFEEDYVDDDDDSIPRYYKIVEDAKNDIYYNAMMWKDLFKEWVEYTVENTTNYTLKQQVVDLLKRPSIKVLSFNYTTFIEDKYNFHEVCHIHNKVGDDTLILGHGSEEEHSDFDYDKKSADNMLHNICRKDVNQQFFLHKDFFDEINEETLDVYSYGFGYNDIDLFYIRKICEKLSEKCVWHLKRYEGTELDYAEVLSKKCKFRGTIDFFG